MSSLLGYFSLREQLYSRFTSNIANDERRKTISFDFYSSRVLYSSVIVENEKF